MGEVYRATDTKLKRDVAIKVLPAAFVEDKERLARFEREAQLLAQLHHPNIASIFGMEESDGTRALVMELVEGTTLAERLEPGALPLEESLSLARQIAQALEAAHDKGIIHRDLKPQNIKVSQDGTTVKVLDFGLAKAMDPAGTASGGPSASQLAASPTLTLGATMQGVILGSAAYMAPEQAKGFAVDKRADIWAFGVVLWEMLTGRRLFEGDSVPETLAGVLKNEVDLDALPTGAPSAIRRLLRRCLERNPKNRLHDIADARIVIDDVLSGRHVEPAVPTSAEVGPAPRNRSRGLAVALVLLIAGGAAGWLLRPRSAPPALADARWMLALPGGTSLSTDDEPQVALSRDGRLQAAVVVGESGVPQIALRRSDAFEPQLLPGTENATAPFFSPDGTWIGFFRDGALMKAPVGGGPAIRIAPLVNVDRGGSWSDDGWIYFVDSFASPLSRVRPGGGEVEIVTHLDFLRSERTHRWPEALPGGGAVLFTCDTLASAEYYDDARIEAVRPATGERRVLVEGASLARYAPGGHLIFARGGSLYAVDFDPRTLEVRGAPVEIVRGVATDVGSGAVQFAISESGAALWAPGGLTASYRVVWVDQQGRETPVEVPPAPYNELALSPDGSRLALVGGPGGISDLWVADLARGTVTRLTSGEIVHMPTWTPDGGRIAYAVVTPGVEEERTRIDWRPADGSRPAETLVQEGSPSYPSSFTPDGRTLVYDQGDGSNSLASNLQALSLDGGHSSRALTEGQDTYFSGAVSPDGRWLAFVSAEAGQNNVYVRPYPEGSGRWQISTSTAAEPRWALDGRALYYRSSAVLYRVAVDTSHGFHAGRPEPLLDRVATGGQVQSYSFSPDGSRIITFRTAPGSGAQRVLNLDLGFAARLGEQMDGRR